MMTINQVTQAMKPLSLTDRQNNSTQQQYMAMGIFTNDM